MSYKANLDELMKNSPALKEAFDELATLQVEEQWCKCNLEEQEPMYYEFYDDDGYRYHGWDCGHCGGLIQTG